MATAPRLPSDPQPHPPTATGPLAGVANFAWNGTTWVASDAAGGGESGSWQSVAWSAMTSVTRPANVLAYLANDVVGADPAASAAIELPGIGPAGGQIMITGVSLLIEAAAIPSGMLAFRLALYDAPPVSAFGDNVPWTLHDSDRDAFRGFLDCGLPVDYGSNLYVEMLAPNKPIKLIGTSLWCYLITNGGHTPVSGTVYRVGVTSVAL